MRANAHSTRLSGTFSSQKLIWLYGVSNCIWLSRFARQFGTNRRLCINLYWGTWSRTNSFLTQARLVRKYGWIVYVSFAIPDWLPAKFTPSKTFIMVDAPTLHRSASSNLIVNIWRRNSSCIVKNIIDEIKNKALVLEGGGLNDGNVCMYVEIVWPCGNIGLKLSSSRKELSQWRQKKYNVTNITNKYLHQKYGISFKYYQKYRVFCWTNICTEKGAPEEP